MVLDENVLIKLMEWFEKNNYSGPDPYTLRGTKLNSLFIQSITISRYWDHLLSILDTQILPLLGLNILPNQSATSLGLLAQTYFLLYENTKNKDYLRKGEKLLRQLIRSKSAGYSGACWGLPFDWKIPYNEKKYIVARKGTPFPTIMTYIMDAFILGYRYLKKTEYLETFLSTENFFLNDLHFKEINGTLCTSYSPVDRHYVNNASSYVVAGLCRLYQYSKSKKILEMIKKLVNYLILQQKNDGSWTYSSIDNTRDCLHQCYILQNLLFANKVLEDCVLEESLKKGLKVFESFKSNNGLFMRLLGEQYFQLIDQAEAVSLYLDLNLKNNTNQLLKSIEKNLYYEKPPFFVTIVINDKKIKCPYPRWGLSQIAYALVKFINKDNII